MADKVLMTDTTPPIVLTDASRPTAEERRTAFEKVRSQAAVVDVTQLTTREKLERGLPVREDVTVSNDHESNLRWAGVKDEKGECVRKLDPPTELHIGPYDIYFNTDAILALIGSKGVYSEHARIIIDNVVGFVRADGSAACC